MKKLVYYLLAFYAILASLSLKTILYYTLTLDYENLMHECSIAFLPFGPLVQDQVFLAVQAPRAGLGFLEYRIEPAIIPRLIN